MTPLDRALRERVDADGPVSAAELREVLDLHVDDPNDPPGWCPTCLCHDPCQTKLGIARALGVANVRTLR